MGMNKISKQSTVGLKELRENMEKYIHAVDKGQSITVFRRSKPIFRLTPVDSEEIGWETIIDFTEINPNGIPASKILAALKKMNG